MEHESERRLREIIVSLDDNDNGSAVEILDRFGLGD